MRDLPTLGRCVLLASELLQAIDRAARCIHVSVSPDAILHGPVVSAQEPITPELQQSLREYYDQYAR
jgi:hypothetical protein